MEGNFSSKVRDVIQFSREEALRLGHDYIGTEHLILGIIRLGDGVAVRILKNLDCDLFKLKKPLKIRLEVPVDQLPWATFHLQNKPKRYFALHI